MEPRISVVRLTKGKLPSLPFEQYKNAILGKKYQLSIVFAGSTLSQKLNKQYRDKDYPTNVLSFPLSKDEGEIIINLQKARSEAKNFDLEYIPFVGYLLIHGMLHLKGLDHGSTMDNEEEKYRKKFSI